MKKVENSLSAGPSATSKVLHVCAGSCISSPISRYDINGAAAQQGDDDISLMPGSSRWSSLVVAVARLLVNRRCHDEKLSVRIEEADPLKKSWLPALISKPFPFK
jgi:hypothetical protein